MARTGARDRTRASRLIVANLDCEAAWARASRPAVALPALAAAARARAADAGAWLAVFARPGDRLWLPDAPSATARARAARFGAELIGGPLGALADADAVLAWGETAEIMELRRRQPSAPEAPAAEPAGGALHLGLWATSPPAPEVAARAADRRLLVGVAERIGSLLPGARPVDSLGALERHLAAGGAAMSDGAFVLKAPFAAAGRERLIHRGPLDDPARARAVRLLARHGELCFEPWLERSADLGQGGIISATAIELLPPHQTEVDARGVFRAAIIDDAGTWLDDRDRATLRRAAGAAGEALAELGYRGPFAIDAFHFRERSGRCVLHPLCEINARLTFGLVARAHAERQADRSRFILAA